MTALRDLMAGPLGRRTLIAVRTVRKSMPRSACRPISLIRPSISGIDDADAVPDRWCDHIRAAKRRFINIASAQALGVRRPVISRLASMSVKALRSRPISTATYLGLPVRKRFLAALLDGKNAFAQATLKAAEKTDAIIVGMGALNRDDSDAVLASVRAKLPKNTGMVSGDGWNGFNVLHTSRIARRWP